MDRFIELKNIVKRYSGRGFLTEKSGMLAVDRVSFSINENTIFGLVGESGCGKTTLARSLLYLDPPTSGEVFFKETRLGSLSPSKLRSFRKRMQIVFQDPNSALNPKMNIRNSMKEGLVNRRFAHNQIESRIDELLDLVGIPPSHKSRHPHEFSGGQKQRIVIARALSMEPDFFVLDEPVSNLDVSIQAQIINLLLDLKKEFSLTYLFISHDLNLVSYLSDYIAVMLKGRIIEMGTTDMIINNPLHPYTLELFSSAPGIKRTQIDLEKQIEKESKYSVSGCPYMEKCSMNDSFCAQSKPELKEMEAGHFTACFKVIKPLNNKRF